ncbi:unnamed protein product [Arctogadus glacialis]
MLNKSPSTISFYSQTCYYESDRSVNHHQRCVIVQQIIGNKVMAVNVFMLLRSMFFLSVVTIIFGANQSENKNFSCWDYNKSH